MAPLDERDLDPDPFQQFATWYQAACAAGVPQPDAMTLATATRDGRPSARMVVLRGFDPRGFVFYTSYASRKGRELVANPHAALVFYWSALERQVRIEGAVCKVSRPESARYFRSRPVGSQLSALASPQSEVIPNRAALVARVQQLAATYAGQEVPVPPDWGGFRLTPTIFEFWQGDPARLHDRIRYTRQVAARWRLERLAP